MNEQLTKYYEYLLARKQSKNYFDIMLRFVSYLDANNIEIKSITQETITNYFNLNSEFSIKTRNQYISAGRHFYSFLGINPNEWHKIKLIKAERKIPDYLTEDDLNTAIKYMVSYCKHYSIPKIEAILAFLFFSTVRKSEFLGLKRVDIDLKNGQAKVYGKGRKERIVYFTDFTKQKLEIYFNSEPEKENAFNITKAKLEYIITILKKNVFPGRKITIHLFRHSGARDMINKGMPIGVVQKILGHSSLQSTILYTDPDQKMIEKNYKEKMR